MGYGLMKVHHAIMKETALRDYNVVRSFLVENKQEEKIVSPKGKHWHKIEDVTKSMLLSIEGANEIFQTGLVRGYDYYLSI